MRSHARNRQVVRSPELGLLLTVSLLFAIAGCTTAKVISSPNPTTIANQVRVGDTVEIIKTNADVVKFKVDHVSQTGLSGDGHSVVFRDITQITVTQFDTGKSVKLVTTVAAGVGAVYLFILAIGKAMQTTTGL